MKLFVALLALAAAFSVSADDIKINGDFKGSRLGHVAPAKWSRNIAAKYKNSVTTKVIAGKEKGKFAIEVASGTETAVPYYTNTTYPVKGGDKIEMEAKVQGKGVVTFLAYCNSKGTYKRVVIGKKLPSKPGEVKGLLQFPAQIEYDNVRLGFSVAKNSKVTVSDVEAEFKK